MSPDSNPAAISGLGAFAALCVRMSGIYFAMLTLAFAQILWSIAVQWDSVTGGSNGIIGVWPPEWLGARTRYYLFVLVVVVIVVVRSAPSRAAARRTSARQEKP